MTEHSHLSEQNDRPARYSQATGKSRPYFTYAGFFASMWCMVSLELSDEFVLAPGTSFLIFAPLVVVSYGADWIRLAKPPADLVKERVVLGWFVVALVLLGLSGDWLKVAFATLAGGAALAVAAWALAARSRSWFEGTYLGQDGERALFERDAERWAFQGAIPPYLQVGVRYGLRAELDERAVEGEGPFRGRARLEGTILEVAASAKELDARRSERAIQRSRDVAIACVAVVVSLGLSNL